MTLQNLYFKFCGRAARDHNFLQNFTWLLIFHLLKTSENGQICRGECTHTLITSLSQLIIEGFNALVSGSGFRLPSPNQLVEGSSQLTGCSNTLVEVSKYLIEGNNTLVKGPDQLVEDSNT